jgi:CRISPR-associated protein Cas1
MSQVIQNTLYLLTQGLYIHRDHLALRIEQDGQLKLSLPIHNLESVLIFGPSAMSPSAMQLCWENNVAVAFLSEHGRFLARIEGVPQGSVLLRRAQHRTAEDPVLTLRLIRNLVAGKIQNSRWLINRTARETTDEAERMKLTTAAQQLAYGLRELQTDMDADAARGCSTEDAGCSTFELPRADDADTIRGIEGHAAALYFEAFPLHLKPSVRERFPFGGRERRPPRDAVNCLLSFLYALLRHDCVAALTAVGLDPFVGFLHTDRPGRESLALDLMEEFRALADRLAITLLNRGEVKPAHFVEREGGAWELTESGRKALIASWQQRKLEETRHAQFKESVRYGQLPFLQARILARVLRGDIPSYLPHLFT